MKGCGVELRVSDLQMNAWTWRVYDTVKARRGMVDDWYAVLYRLQRQVWTWYRIQYNKTYKLSISAEPGLAVHLTTPWHLHLALLIIMGCYVSSFQENLIVIKCPKPHVKLFKVISFVTYTE